MRSSASSGRTFGGAGPGLRADLVSHHPFRPGEHFAVVMLLTRIIATGPHRVRVLGLHSVVHCKQTFSSPDPITGRKHSCRQA